MQLFQELNTKETKEKIFVGDIFFESITYAAYAQSDKKNSDELCRMAKQWLERLEKTL